MREVVRAGLMVLGLTPAVAIGAAAQQWSATAQVGRVTSGSGPLGTGSQNAAMVLGITRSGAADWLGLSAALPLNDDPFWAVLAGWKRVATPGESGALLDLSGHGFYQREPSSLVAGAAETAGAGFDARAGLFARAGAFTMEARGGAAGERSDRNGSVSGRLLPAADARLSLLRAPVVVQAEARAWWDGGARHTWTGGTLQVSRGVFQVWASGGAWLTGGVAGATWGAGARVGVGHPVELQLLARGNTFDPLYLTTTRTTFSMGVSARLGRGPASLAPIAERNRDGRSVIRIAARDAAGAPSIAGDFTGWKPVPMRRQGDRWIWEARLEPGVYHYAFVAADGQWFVPKSVKGRQDDGMGGETAVLVVAS